MSRPAGFAIALGITGEDPDQRGAKLLGHLDPLLDLGHLALTQGRVGAAEVVVDADANDGQSQLACRSAEHLEVRGAGLGEMNVLQFHALDLEITGAAMEKTDLIHEPAVEGAVEGPADAAELHVASPFGGRMVFRAASTSRWSPGLALQTRL